MAAVAHRLKRDGTTLCQAPVWPFALPEDAMECAACERAWNAHNNARRGLTGHREATEAVPRERAVARTAPKKRRWTALDPALEEIFAASWAYTDDPLAVRLARWAHGDRIRIAAIYRPALVSAGRKSLTPTTTRRG